MLTKGRERALMENELIVVKRKRNGGGFWWWTWLRVKTMIVNMRRNKQGKGRTYFIK